MNRGRIETIGSPREVFRSSRVRRSSRAFSGSMSWPGTLLGPTSDGPDGQRYAQVALADGFSLWGVIDDDHAVTAGAPVVVCLRREHMDVAAPSRLIGPSRRRVALSEGQIFAGEVRAASFLGLEEELMIVIAGMELRAVTSGERGRDGRCGRGHHPAAGLPDLPRDRRSLGRVTNDRVIAIGSNFNRQAWGSPATANSR